MRAAFFLFLLVTWMTGWAVGSQTMRGEPVRWSTYLEGSNSQIAEPAQKVVELQTAGQFEQYWSKLTGQPVSRAPREIDFTKEKVIVLHLGKQASGGFRVYVETMDVFAGQLRISAVIQTPGRNEVVSQAITYPFVAVRVERTAGRPSVSWRNQVGGAQGFQPLPGCSSFKPCGCCTACGAFELEWETLLFGEQSAPLSATQYWIRNRTEFQSYWTRVLNRNVNDYDDLGINWNREAVAAIHLGAKAGEGFGVVVERVLGNRFGTIQILYSVENPLTSRFVNTSPFVTISIPRSNTRPIFHWVATRTIR